MSPKRNLSETKILGGEKKDTKIKKEKKKKKVKVKKDSVQYETKSATKILPIKIPEQVKKKKTAKRKKSKHELEKPETEDITKKNKVSKKTKKKKAKNNNIIETTENHQSTIPDPVESPKHEDTKEEKSMQPSDVDYQEVQQTKAKSNEGISYGRSFRRVADEDWLGKKGSWNNSYSANFGNDGWGAKAQSVLGQVRGKNFRHEKTKKKKGTYFGGKISTEAINSIKFDSDDE
eukprot:g1777.t1